MLQRSRFLCMPIGTACRVMGFHAPPVTKKELKKRFVELAKQRHPDQNGGEEGATANMVQLTEAYTTLKKLLDTGVRATTSPSAKAGAQAGAESEWENVAKTFQAPGSAISLRGFVLPWQRCGTSSAVGDVESLLKRPDLTFSDYVTATRSAERQRALREERIKQDAARSTGSHGYTAEYFERVRQRQDLLRGGQVSHRSSSYVGLAWRFYSKRLLDRAVAAPRKVRDAIRYIIQGG